MFRDGAERAPPTIGCSALGVGESASLGGAGGCYLPSQPSSPLEAVGRTGLGVMRAELSLPRAVFDGEGMDDPTRRL